MAALGESELGLGYKISPILGPIGDEPQSSSVAAVGYRVGDAGPLKGTASAVRLHELMAHTGHTLLVLVGDADGAKAGEWLKMARQIASRFAPHIKAFVAARNVTAQEPSGDLLVDATGALHARLGGSKAPALCLVRPDGHLGLRLTPPVLPAVESYFSRILA
jgi:NADPH-dependent dioxygenase